MNNNNNNPIDLNDNNNPDDVIVASSEEVSPAFVDGEYRNMSSDDSGSSSEDESSESFSDTSPLLDVSSLDNSDVSLDDSDMSEDSSSSSSSSDNEEDLLEDDLDCDNNNNNGDDEDLDEDVSIVDAPMSMQSSWMSFSSASSVAGPSRGQAVVLPDVLPVGKIPKAKDEDCDDEELSASYGAVATRNLEITFEKRRSNQDIGTSRVSGDRCLVEITAQPDVQVDIRVNPVSSRPRRESRPVTIKHGNTYPREARNNKRYLKNRDINAWIVNDSFDEHYDDRNKSWTLDEGIRLNNFTIVNGQKTLSLTELMNTNSYNKDSDAVLKFDSDTLNSAGDSQISKTTTPPLTNSYQNFERNYSKLPANVHMCCKDNWRHQKDFKNVVHKQKPPAVEVCAVDKFTQASISPDTESFSPKVPSQKPRNIAKDVLMEKSKKSIPAKVSEMDSNSNQLAHADKLPPKPRKEPAYYASRKKAGNSKLSSPELFEVYTMETALPQINWSAISKGSRESDWLRKVSVEKIYLIIFLAKFYTKQESGVLVILNLRFCSDMYLLNDFGF